MSKLINYSVYCRKFRHVAYRQLTRWCWQWLGKDLRVALPSCAVTKIRNEFTSTSGTLLVLTLDIHDIIISIVQTMSVSS